MWLIFNGPYSSTCGHFPVSSLLLLDWLIEAMRSGTMPATLGTPLQSILGGSEGGTGGGNCQEGDPNGPRYLSKGPKHPANTKNVHAKIE
jgi:hypothetical protein